MNVKKRKNFFYKNIGRGSSGGLRNNFDFLNLPLTSGGVYYTCEDTFSD